MAPKNTGKINTLRRSRHGITFDGDVATIRTLAGDSYMVSPVCLADYITWGRRWKRLQHSMLADFENPVNTILSYILRDDSHRMILSEALEYPGVPPLDALTTGQVEELLIDIAFADSEGAYSSSEGRGLLFLVNGDVVPSIPLDKLGK